MSPTTADTTPLATQAAILTHIADARHPRIEIPNAAHHYGMTLQQLQTILNRHGYPDPARMRREAAQLLEQLQYLNDEPPATGGGFETFPGPTSQGDLGKLTQVPVNDLHADPNNVREDVGDVTELADSMLEVGLLQPIVARRHNQVLYVVAGHRRLAAARHLHWTHVPCIIRADMRPDDVLAAMLIENGQRSDLDPIEEARGLSRLKTQLDCSDAELGRRVGRNQVFVSGRLALLDLTIEEQEQVRAGTMKLVEATAKGRLNSGKVRPAGQDKGWHLGPNHDLATRAKARCIRLKHPRGRTVGGMACGACWESVIRADERERLHAHSATTGDCALCSQPVNVTPRATS